MHGNKDTCYTHKRAQEAQQTRKWAPNWKLNHHKSDTLVQNLRVLYRTYEYCTEL